MMHDLTALLLFLSFVALRVVSCGFVDSVLALTIHEVTRAQPNKAASINLGLHAQQPAVPTVSPQPSQTLQSNPTADLNQDVVRITTNLVQIDVVVTKDNKQVTDLTADDFEIFEDGQPQPITSFAYVSNTSANKSTSAPAKSAEVMTEPKVTQRTAVGRTFALVIDDLGMSFDSMDRVRKQLRKFVEESLGPNDLVAVIRTGGDIGALQQFTTDRRVLLTAIDRLQWNPCSRMGTSVLSPERSLITILPPEPQLNSRIPPDRSPSSGIIAPRAIQGRESNPCSVGNSLQYSIKSLRFILRGMGELPGRKSLLLFSDNLPVERQELEPVDFGFKRPVRENANIIDPWSESTSFHEGLQRLAELAIRSSVVIYGLDTQALQTLGPRPADEVNLPPKGARTRPDQDSLLKLSRDRAMELRRNSEGTELIAKQTGGFVVRNANDLGLDKVMDDQGGYYLVGYRPAGETFDRRFHQIKARVKGRNLTVRTRAGFYGVADRASSESNRTRMDRALTSPFGAQELTVNVFPLYVDDPARGSVLRTILVVDPKQLVGSDEPDGTRRFSFDISAALIGDNGAIVTRQDQNGVMRMRGKPYERALREGMVYTFDLPVKRAGGYQFRVVVRDTTSSHIGAVGKFVEVPNLGNGELVLSGILLQADDSVRTVSTTSSEASSDALLRFRQGTSLLFGYLIYNARLEQKTKLPQLTTETHVFRDQKEVYSAGSTAISLRDQSDLRRISAGARLQLGSESLPGEYVLQIIVKDLVAKKAATQWIQFQIVK
jgi:VWFA-related protein